MGNLLGSLSREQSTPEDVDQYLCYQCREVEKGMLCPHEKGGNYPKVAHYRYFQQISTSASKGCQLCRVLEQGLLHAQVHGTSTGTPIHSIEDARKYLLHRDDLLATGSARSYEEYRITLRRQEFPKGSAEDPSSAWDGFPTFECKRLFIVGESFKSWEIETGAIFVLCVKNGASFLPYTS